MIRKLTLPVALCALALLCRPVLAADDDPKGVVTAFFKAMETGDVAGAKALAVGSDKQLAVLDVLVPVFHGFKQLETAAVKKWGEEGRKTLTEGPGGGLNVAEKLKNAKVDVKGDAATITPADAKPEDKNSEMKLKKVEGKWKLDMASIPAEGMDDPKALKMFKGMAEVAQQTAKEVDQGKYASANEAKQAMGQKILQMMGIALPPGAAPGQPGDAGKEEPKK
jgi:hypothetical protein